MKQLFCDCKTDEEKAKFFLSGRAVETGIIAPAISNDVSMAYHRCAEFQKEIDILRAKIADMEKQEPVAWAATDETKTVVEALGMNHSRRFDSPLYLAPGAQPALSVPDGWKLVPIEPTQEMINHAIHERLGAFVAGEDHTFIDIYKAMLAAAPEAKP